MWLAGAKEAVVCVCKAEVVGLCAVHNGHSGSQTPKFFNFLEQAD
jgi:hypothetical protein